MNFLTVKEKKISNKFLKSGFVINKVENKKSLQYISILLKKKNKKNFKKKVL